MRLIGPISGQHQCHVIINWPMRSLVTDHRSVWTLDTSCKCSIIPPEAGLGWTLSIFPGCCMLHIREGFMKQRNIYCPCEPLRWASALAWVRGQCWNHFRTSVGNLLNFATQKIRFTFYGDFSAWKEQNLRVSEFVSFAAFSLSTVLFVNKL